MEMSVNLEPSFHRSIGYPLLIKLTGWNVSNWPLIFLQGLLLSVILFRLISHLFPTNRYRFHVLVVALLAFFSSTSWYAAQLMPDVFTLIFGLGLLSFLLEKRPGIGVLVTYGVLFFVCCLTHLSHIPLLLLMAISALIIQRFFPDLLSLPRASWAVLGTVLIASWLFISSFNAYHNMGFGMSKASNVFLTANIAEMGFLKMYLDENCGERTTSLCDIKDSLPQETGGFLWDGNGPVQSHPGGWEGANEDYAPIVKDFLTKPRYLKWFLFGAVKATFKQMFQIELGSGLQYQYGEGTPPYWPMREHYKQELNEYLTSVQNKKDELPLTFFRGVHYLALLMTILILGWVLVTHSLSRELRLLLLLSFAFYFFHASITGVLANVYERLQCRTLPLIMLVAILSAMHLAVTRSSQEKNHPTSV